MNHPPGDRGRPSEAELRRAELAISKSEDRFAKVFHSGLVALGIAEMSSGRLIDVNARCAEFFGYARDEMIGRTVFELGLWADPADRERLVAGLSAGRSTSGGEVPFQHRSGEIRQALVSMEAMTLAGIAEPLSIVALVDITERKRLELQLVQAQKMEAVGRLAGGVAHDFNNELGVILGYTELLMRQAGEAERAKLEQIQQAAQRATDLTRQLLAFSRKQPEVSETPTPSKGWETILLVEDEATLRAIAREILEADGYRVIEAAGPKEAIEMADRHPEPIHLLLTDVVMPGMNGRALAESLVVARPRLRVLYMSGYTDDVVAHRGVFESGALFLAKPFTVLALLRRVRTALDEPGPEEHA